MDNGKVPVQQAVPEESKKFRVQLVERETDTTIVPAEMLDLQGALFVPGGLESDKDIWQTEMEVNGSHFWLQRLPDNHTRLPGSWELTDEENHQLAYTAKGNWIAPDRIPF